MSHTDGATNLVPLLVGEERIQKIAKSKVVEATYVSAILQYVPYWVYCYTFLIPRIFMKPRPMEIWIACDARSGKTFPIRLDRDIIKKDKIGSEAELIQPSIEESAAEEYTREAAYEAFVKRFLALKDPTVSITFNKLAYFPMWKVMLRQKEETYIELLINGRTGIIEQKKTIR